MISCEKLPAALGATRFAKLVIHVSIHFLEKSVDPLECLLHFFLAFCDKRFVSNVWKVNPHVITGYRSRGSGEMYGRPSICECVWIALLNGFLGDEY